MIIRPMAVKDLYRVSEIEAISNPEPWTYADFEDSLAKEDGTTVLLVAEDVDVIGYLVLYTASGESEIVTIAVSPEARRKGVGRRLIDEVIAFSKKSYIYIGEINLEVRISNEPAIKLYESVGFSAVGKRPNFYSNPKEDALLMKRILNA